MRTSPSPSQNRRVTSILASTLTFALVSALASASAAASAAISTRPAPSASPTPYESFEKHVSAGPDGKARLSYRITGEPVMAPARFEVWLKCPGEREETLIETVMMCELKNYNYDSKLRLLTLSYVEGRTEPETGHVRCDVDDEKEIKLARLCRKKNSKK